jgi:hypothetical protein
LFRCRLFRIDFVGDVSGHEGEQRGQRDGWIVASYRLLLFECHRHWIHLLTSCRFRIRCPRVFLRRMYSAVRKQCTTEAYREEFAPWHGFSPSGRRHHDPCGEHSPVLAAESQMQEPTSRRPVCNHGFVVAPQTYNCNRLRALRNSLEKHGEIQHASSGRDIQG